MLNNVQEQHFQIYSQDENANYFRPREFRTETEQPNRDEKIKRKMARTRQVGDTDRNRNDQQGLGVRGDGRDSSRSNDNRANVDE